MALTDFDKQQLNANQQAALAAATQRWNTAKQNNDTAGMQAAHIEAQNIRAQAGYQGDASGNYAGTPYTSTARKTTSSPVAASAGTSANTGTGAVTAPVTGAYQINSDLGRQYYNNVLYGGNGARMYMNDKGANGEFTQLVNENGVVYAIKDGVKRAVQVGNGTSVANGGQSNGQNNGQTSDNSVLLALLNLIQNPNNSYLSAQKKANDAAVQRAVNELNEQKRTTDLSYADLFRQLYINKMRSKKDLDQQLAAQGITGGLAETTRLGIDTSYADALRQGEIERLNTLAKLDQAATDTQLQGDLTYAQMAAQEAQQRQQSYANLLSSLLNRQYQLEDTASQRAWQEALTKQGWAREDEVNAKNRQLQQEDAAQQIAFQQAMTILNAGKMPPEEILSAAGISTKAAEVLTSIGMKNQSKYTQDQAQTAVALALQGDRSQNVRAIIEGYFGLPLEDVIRVYA